MKWYKATIEGTNISVKLKANDRYHAKNKAPYSLYNNAEAKAYLDSIAVNGVTLYKTVIEAL